ncbi:hypothetical protein GJ496_008864 [Pomphorhynchus laevis]|nr:hypothetical protein GJ496_008864 [Pomphorhynchus laevis]
MFADLFDEIPVDNYSTLQDLAVNHKLTIVQSDFSRRKVMFAEKCIYELLQECECTEQMSNKLREQFTKEFKDNWSVIVGFDLMCSVTHSPRCFYTASLGPLRSRRQKDAVENKRNK